MLWCALPALEELQTAWEAKHDSECFSLYKQAINNGLQKLWKYYSHLDSKPVFILALSKFFYHVLYQANISVTVLHPYYKLDYIKLTWGGADEQAKEHTAGNLDAKNWQDEALVIIKMTVSVSIILNNIISHMWCTDGAVLQEACKSRSHQSALDRQQKYDISLFQV
jgi:hypothetical protein